MDRIEQIKATNYMRVAEQIYKHQNPTSKMDTPNSVYILTERFYKEWCNDYTDLSLFDWIIKNK